MGKLVAKQYLTLHKLDNFSKVQLLTYWTDQNLLEFSYHGFFLCVEQKLRRTETHHNSRGQYNRSEED